MPLLDADRATADVWRSSVVAEIAWIGPDGPAAAAVVPLELDGRLCTAVPYHRLDEVSGLRDGTRTTWTVTDPHGGRSPGMRVSGTVRVRDDLDGDEFVDRLLDQELRRHPPTRLRADSVMQRREHWWWLPRRLIVLDTEASSGRLPRRQQDTDGLLVTAATDGAVQVGVVAVDVAHEGDSNRRSDGGVTADQRAGQVLELEDLGGGAVRGAAETALLFGHDYAVPDLSRWDRWQRRGQLRGANLDVEVGAGTPGAASSPPRLRDRLRDELAVGRGCRRGLRTVRSELARARENG